VSNRRTAKLHRPCALKTWYGTSELASIAILQVQQQTKSKRLLFIEDCPYCSGFHVTPTSPRRGKAER
jgi:hypothetical protein